MAIILLWGTILLLLAQTCDSGSKSLQRLRAR
jgi:hypothetical protein